MDSLSGVQNTKDVPVSWSGTDGGAGVQDYTVYVSDNGGPFTAWLTDTAATTDTFAATAGHAYGFYTIARDLVGNVENPKSAAETTTTISTPIATVNMTADAATVVAGTAIGFTVQVTNNAGLGTAAGVTLTDPLPAGASLNWSIDPVYSGPGTCSLTGAAGSQTLTCNIGDMAEGSSTSVHISSGTTAAGCAAYANTATVTAGNSSPAQSSATVTVLCTGLTISKTHAGNFTQGQTGATYTVTVGNSAGSAPTSSPVTVTETVPAGMTLVSMSGGTTWNCASLPTCTTSEVLPGGSSYAPITVTVNVAAGAASQLTNQVTVSGGGSASASTSDVTSISTFTCDLNGDQLTNVVDVQLIINEALGVIQAIHDLNHDSAVNVADVQKLINGALGMGCPY